MNEIVPKSSKKTQKPSILQRIKHGVENSLQNELLKQSNTGFLLHEYTGITDTEFCQQFDKDELTVTYRKAVTTDLTNKAPLSVFSDQLEMIIKDCGSAKDYLLMSRFLFRLQKHTSTSITNLLKYVHGPYKGILEKNNVNFKEHLCIHLSKRLFQLHALDQSYEFGPDLVGPPWQVFGTIYLEQILEHTTPLHHQLPAQLDTYSIFDDDKKKLKDVRLLWQKAGIELPTYYLKYALKPYNNVGFDREYFHAYTTQHTTRTKSMGQDTTDNEVSPSDIETHTLDLMEKSLKITQDLSKTRYERKKTIISKLFIQKESTVQTFLKTFGTYICAGMTTWKELYNTLQGTIQRIPDIRPIERFICEDAVTHDIDIYTTQKTLRTIKVLHGKKTPLKDCETPETAQMMLQKALEADAPIKPSEHSFTEKRSFIQRKQAIATTLKSQWTPEEYKELFGNMDFKKRYFTHAIPEHNKIKQGALPNCFFVAVVCGMLPLNFVQEVCMQMLSKDPENPNNYKVRLGSTSFVVTPEERAQRTGIKAPEFIKIIEIAFQKAHTHRFIRNHITKGVGYLGLAAVAASLTSGSIATTRYMHTANENIDTLMIYMMDTVLLLINIGMRGLIYEKFFPEIKGYIAGWETLKTGPEGDIIHHGGGHSRVAFKQLFPKKIRTFHEIELFSYESIIDLYTQLKGLSAGTSIISAATGIKNQDPRKIYKHHAYTVLPYNPKTHEISLVNPHDNTKLLTMGIIDFLYIFSENDIMKFQISKMFR